MIVVLAPYKNLKILSNVSISSHLTGKCHNIRFYRCIANLFIFIYQQQKKKKSTNMCVRCTIDSESENKRRCNLAKVVLFFAL